MSSASAKPRGRTRRRPRRQLEEPLFKPSCDQALAEHGDSASAHLDCAVWCLRRLRSTPDVLGAVWNLLAKAPLAAFTTVRDQPRAASGLASSEYGLVEFVLAKNPPSGPSGARLARYCPGCPQNTVRERVRPVDHDTDPTHVGMGWCSLRESGAPVLRTGPAPRRPVCPEA